MTVALLWLQDILRLSRAIQQVLSTHTIARMQVQISNLYKASPDPMLDRGLLDRTITRPCACAPTLMLEPYQSQIR